MTWAERAMLITAVSAALVNLLTALWTLLRACQTYNLLRKERD